MSTQNLSFDDGFKEFTINNDPKKVIRFNPTDFGFISRLKNEYEAIDKAAETAGDIKLNPDGSAYDNLVGASDAVEIYNKAVRDAIDDIFNSNISDIAFGRQSAISLVGNGKFLWESFLECICKVIEKETGEKIAASKKKIDKYKGQVYRR
jgi:hypothetical protein